MSCQVAFEDYHIPCLKNFSMILSDIAKICFPRQFDKDEMLTGAAYKEKKEAGRYAEDLYYANLLVSGDNRAWNLFYKEYRRKVGAYIETKYPNVFGVSDIEEICDGVQKRLTSNNYRALREYKGNCSFSRYLTQATDWEIKDWFKKNSHKLQEEPVEDALNREELSTKDRLYEPENNIFKAASSLPEDLRQALYLRYYDHFGFPPEEIRLLSKKRGIPIKEISEMIIRHLELQDEDLLNSRRENQQAFEDRLKRLFSGISKLRDKERKLLEKLKEVEASGGEGLQEIEDQIKEIREKIASKEEKGTQFKEEGNTDVATPYETIGVVLGEDNLSTVRSRVFHAKKVLKDILQKERNK